jgi:hypothetical protein
MLLKTPPLTSEYTMHVDQKDGKDVLVCTVDKTVLLQFDTQIFKE